MDSSLNISILDYHRIAKKINSVETKYNTRFQYVNVLKQILRRANKVLPEEISPDVVTMNSTVLVKNLTTKHHLELKIVYHNQRGDDYNHVSIFSPVGIALIGRKKNEIVEFHTGSRNYKFKILKIVYQPESVGDFHL